MKNRRWPTLICGLVGLGFGCGCVTETGSPPRTSGRLRSREAVSLYEQRRSNESIPLRVARIEGVASCDATVALTEARLIVWKTDRDVDEEAVRKQAVEIVVAETGLPAERITVTFLLPHQ